MGFLQARPPRPRRRLTASRLRPQRRRRRRPLRLCSRQRWALLGRHRTIGRLAVRPGTWAAPKRRGPPRTAPHPTSAACTSPSWGQWTCAPFLPRLVACSLLTRSPRAVPMYCTTARLLLQRPSARGWRIRTPPVRRRPPLVPRRPRRPRRRLRRQLRLAHPHRHPCRRQRPRRSCLPTTKPFTMCRCGGRRVRTTRTTIATTTRGRAAVVGGRGAIAGAVGPPVGGESARQGGGGGGPPHPVGGGEAGCTWPRVRALVRALGGRRRRRLRRAALEPPTGLDWWGCESSAQSCWASPCGWRRRGLAMVSLAVRVIGLVDRSSRWAWSDGDSPSTANGPLLGCSVGSRSSLSQRTWWRLVAGRVIAAKTRG